MSALRIAHVSATFPPYRGGTGNVCFYNARELARRGHEVQVFSAAVAGTAAYEVIDGVAVHRLRPLVRIGNAPVLAGLPGRLRGFDLVHLHAPFILGAELTALAASARHIPLVVTYHNDLIRDGSWRDVVFRVATSVSRSLVLERARRVLFVSEGHATTCEQRGVYQQRRGCCAILPNGVDTAVFRLAGDRDATRQRLGIGADTPLVGFVGGLDRAHHYKGLGVLLDALGGCDLRGAAALVVGDGDLREAYQRQAQGLGLAGRVHFYGAAGHDTLPQLYRTCDVVAVPSLVAESFGLVVAEALACGIPVVASAGPGTNELLRDSEDGMLVPPGERAALAAALRALLMLPAAQRQATGAQRQARVALRYSWDELGRQLERVYQHVLHDEARERAYGESV